MKFLILLPKSNENKESNKINKDRLLFIVYQILQQYENTKLMINELYTSTKDYNNLELLKQIEKLAKFADTFRIEWIDFNTYFVINIYY